MSQFVRDIIFSTPPSGESGRKKKKKNPENLNHIIFLNTKQREFNEYLTMTAILVFGIIFILVVIMLPVFKGMGNYKQKILEQNPELAAKQERKRLRREEREKQRKRQEAEDRGEYRPSSWDNYEETESSSFASGMKDRANQMMSRVGGGGVKLEPNVPSNANKQNVEFQYNGDASKPYSSHINNNFDYDGFINEQEKLDRQNQTYSNPEDVA